jgi:hypothetical protein
MALASRVREEWRDQARSHLFEPSLTLTEDGLVLGSETVLAKRRCGGRQRDSALALSGAEERIVALLSVAYGKAIGPAVLGNLHRASAAWQDGETCLALIHLAHAGLPRLEDDEADFRLSAAHRLLASGIAPRDLLEACDIDTAPLDLLKAGFNPDEPRVPAGNPDGGRWTTGDGAEGASSRAGHSAPAAHDDQERRHEPADTIRPTTDPSEPAGTGFQLAAYKVVEGTPKGAVVVVPRDGIPIKAGDPPTLLIAPTGANFRDVYAAGQRISSDPFAFQGAQIKANLQQGGIYDFQRDPIRQETYPAYANASNYAVGIYMAGAGFSLFWTRSIAETYALVLRQ